MWGDEKMAAEICRDGFSAATCPSSSWKMSGSPALDLSTPLATSFPRVSPLLVGSAFFVGCLAVLGSSLPHDTHVPPPRQWTRASCRG